MRNNYLPLFLLLFTASYGWSQVNCQQIPNWEQTMIYNTGDRVVLGNECYEANWMSYSTTPHNNSGKDNPWKYVGVCVDVKRTQPVQDVHINVKIPSIS